MRHAKRGRKLNRTSSHRKALLRNMATSLFEHKRLSTTVSKAKELRPYAEQLITKAKHALENEKAGKLPEGQTVDIHNRRMVAKHLMSKAVLQELFDTIAPMVEERNGGYCRIIKTGFRRGDAAQTAIIELVDWSAPQDGATGTKKKKSTAKPKKSKKSKKKAEEVVDEAPVEVKDTAEASVETADAVVEAAEEVKDAVEETVEATEETAEEVKEDAVEAVVETAEETTTEEKTVEAAEEAAEVAEETADAPEEEKKEDTAEDKPEEETKEEDEEKKA